jgi:hypothetical protein
MPQAGKEDRTSARSSSIIPEQRYGRSGCSGEKEEAPHDRAWCTRTDSRMARCGFWRHGRYRSPSEHAVVPFVHAGFILTTQRPAVRRHGGQLGKWHEVALFESVSSVCPVVYIGAFRGVVSVVRGLHAAVGFMVSASASVKRGNRARNPLLSLCPMKPAVIRQNRARLIFLQRYDTRRDNPCIRRSGF